MVLRGRRIWARSAVRKRSVRRACDPLHVRFDPHGGCDLRKIANVQGLAFTQHDGAEDGVFELTNVSRPAESVEQARCGRRKTRSEEHTSELQSHSFISH